MMDPNAKNETMISRTGLRPKIDARPPHMGKIAVDASAYALPAQIKSSPFKRSVMVGKAVEIAVYECNQM